MKPHLIESPDETNVLSLLDKMNIKDKKKTSFYVVHCISLPLHWAVQRLKEVCEGNTLIYSQVCVHNITCQFKVDCLMLLRSRT